MTRADHIKALEDLGYVVTLYSTEEVTDYYECSDTEASIIIESVLDSDELHERIKEDIQEKAFDYGLEPLDEFKQ